MFRTFAGLAAAAAVALCGAVAIAGPGGLSDDTPSQQGRDKGQYIPAIWVDPDGCEHWVMDDGVEGYMTPHITRDGRPVCRSGRVCGVMPSDQFFATDSYRISTAGRAELARFFRDQKANSFIITGHTDSRASDAYNLRLSRNRANAVAAIARAQGARVAEVRGLGERKPAVPNTSPANMAKNRRVEIVCLK